MKITRIILGELQTNCYILTINDKCIIIDPAAEYDKIQKELRNKKVVGIIITHSHFDHIGALNKFDKNLIFDKNNLEEKEYSIDKFNFEIIYTPGHKEDCISIYFKKENIMFTGDFIFKGAIGRTDLPGGDYNEMLNSLKKIKKYNKDIKVYPGHGEYTYLYNEID